MYALDVAGDREILEDEFEEYPPPDMEAMSSALDAKALKECWICGEMDWSLPPGTNMIAAGARPGGEIDMDLAFEVVAVICQSCGFVRMHHVGRLLD